MFATILLQAQTDSDGLVDKALEVTPYGTLVYGFLVAILIVAIVILYRDRNKSEANAKELADKTVSLMVKLEDRLPSVQQFTEINVALKNVKEIVDKINEKT